MEIQGLNEMALSRPDAISLCISLGTNFIEHYLKATEDLKNKNDGLLRHHCQEMQSWWNKVRNLKLKSSNKPLTDVNLIDWFFTAGSSVEEFMDENNELEYNKLILALLNNRDQVIYGLLRKGQ